METINVNLNKRIKDYVEGLPINVVFLHDKYLRSSKLSVLNEILQNNLDSIFVLFGAPTDIKGALETTKVNFTTRENSKLLDASGNFDTIYDITKRDYRDYKYKTISSPSGASYGIIEGRVICFHSFSEHSISNFDYFIHLLSKGINHIDNEIPIYNIKEEHYKFDKSDSDFIEYTTELKNIYVRKHENLKNSIQELERKLINDIREFNVMEQSLIANSSIDEKIAKQLEVINQNSRIAYAKIKNGSLCFLVKDVLVNEQYNIGNILVMVHLRDANVKVHNITKQRRGYDGSFMASHPHQMSDKTLCLGNIKSYIPKLLANYELVPLVDMLISFMDHANLEDMAGRSINNWIN